MLDLVTLLPLALARGATLSTDPVSGVWGWLHVEWLLFVLVFQGLISTVVGQCVWNLSFHDGDPLEITLGSMLEPVLAGSIAAIFRIEAPPTSVVYASGALILMGCTIASIDPTILEKALLPCCTKSSSSTRLRGHGSINTYGLVPSQPDETKNTCAFCPPQLICCWSCCENLRTGHPNTRNEKPLVIIETQPLFVPPSPRR